MFECVHRQVKFKAISRKDLWFWLAPKNPPLSTRQLQMDYLFAL